MIGLKFWSKGGRETNPETGTVSLREFDLVRQAFEYLRPVDKRGKNAGGQVCQSCLFDPISQFFIQE